MNIMLIYPPGNHPLLDRNESAAETWKTEFSNENRPENYISKIDLLKFKNSMTLLTLGL